MIFKFPSNKTLAKIAVYGAIFSVSSVAYMQFRIKDQIRNQKYFREAMSELRKNPGAIKLLGEPIRESGFELAGTKNWFKGGKIEQFEISVKGSKDKGTIFFDSDKTDEGWILKKLELEVKAHPDKRFLVKANS
ncbi:uncharacterized protein LOC129607552 [Condylostylus longicornis]|uniref:uncharacterized protein LOC129607552 n=1 Tax=Condylostylus longicornis TaxID=2530218 RepID=UPI00244E06E4|nr:uncharacterized protein LOC129607552 [Condylostylus longicornis]